METPTKRLIGRSATVAPLFRPLPPNRPKIGDTGERSQLAETLTQGGARGDSGPQLLPLAGPGLKFCRPLQGSQGKQRHPAAALLKKNVHSLSCQCSAMIVTDDGRPALPETYLGPS